MLPAKGAAEVTCSSNGQRLDEARREGVTWIEQKSFASNEKLTSEKLRSDVSPETLLAK